MKSFKLYFLFLCFFGLSACSTLNKSDDLSTQTLNDPLERYNRSVFSFNTKADKVLFKPVAQAYNNVVPKPAKAGFSNFFGNLGEPLNIINNTLQGKFDRALTSTYRFVVNSTIGLFGLFDVADKHDVYAADEDFGQTLGAWGVKPGSYLVLPLLGPTNLRDGFGRVTDRVLFNPYSIFANTSQQENALILFNAVDLRYRLLNFDKLLLSQIDPYSFVRLGYEKNRINSLYDGNPPELLEEDFNDF